MSRASGLAVLAVTLIIAGCDLVPRPAPAEAPVQALHVENRGGPDLVFHVAGAPDVQAPCNGGATIAPGTAGVPGLPWRLEVRRAGDGGLVIAEVVTELPRWFVQIGHEVVGGGLNPSPVEGPPGPACPG